MKKRKRWKPLGKRLERFRVDKGCTQAQVADAIGVSTRQWKRYAKGDRVSRERILKISEVLEMPLGRTLLLAGYEPEEPGVDINAYLRLLRDNVFEGQMHEALFNLYDFYYDVNKEEKKHKLRDAPMLANAFTAAAVAIDSMPDWLRGSSLCISWH